MERRAMPARPERRTGFAFGPGPRGEAEPLADPAEGVGQARQRGDEEVDLDRVGQDQKELPVGEGTRRLVVLYEKRVPGRGEQARYGHEGYAQEVQQRRDDGDDPRGHHHAHPRLERGDGGVRFTPGDQAPQDQPDARKQVRYARQVAHHVVPVEPQKGKSWCSISKCCTKITARSGSNPVMKYTPAVRSEKITLK